ncbi:MAG: hypothetical protein J6N55_11625 [Anaerovibrio sp.]|uniref:hypothetical protein n=1 Tax=Anaerovibrio sp. TaxID=1872532 RepID=UPI001B01800C|nr:hypothetical protein [Anaerovibrio sp.]MBO6246909.1 hypothetical protein [Anaerovibrio sp.]
MKDWAKYAIKRAEDDVAMIPFYIFEMARAKERRSTRLLTVALIIISIIGLWGWIR